MNQPPATERDCEQAQLLLEEYSFDLSRFSARQLMAIWRERLGADPSWIRAAVIEALYLGRYKAFSVEQILQGWKRRGRPVRHFNSEFERVVFSPIDPTISKYAPTPPSSSSQLMDSTPDSAIAAPADAEAVTTNAETDGEGDAPIAETPVAEIAAPATTPPQVAPPPELPTLQPKTVTPPASDAPPTEDDTPAASMFSQPEPIQKFTPESESSEFYERLQAVARESQ